MREMTLSTSTMNSALWPTPNEPRPPSLADVVACSGITSAGSV
jgi:hypothetical protein